MRVCAKRAGGRARHLVGPLAYSPDQWAHQCVCVCVCVCVCIGGPHQRACVIHTDTLTHVPARPEEGRGEY